MRTRGQQEKKIPPIPLILYYGLLAIILIYIGISWVMGGPKHTGDAADKDVIRQEASAPHQFINE